MAENQSKHRPGGASAGKRRADEKKAERRAAREAVMTLLFETEYHEDEAPEIIFQRAAETREADLSGRYIQATYEGIMRHRAVIDALIEKHATGWRTGRLSRISRAVLRLGTYELAFDGKIPAPIAINEAVELSKKYDDPKARAFINGVLNAIKDDLAAAEGRIPADVLAAACPAVMAPAPAEVADLVALDGAEPMESIPAEDLSDDTAALLALDGATEADLTAALTSDETD